MKRLLGALILSFLVPTARSETPVSAPTFGQARDPEYRFVPVVAGGATSFLVAWEERVMEAWPNTSAVYFRTFNADGTPRQPARVRVTDYGMAPAVAWNGTDYFVVWGKSISRFGSIVPIPAVEGVRITEEGRVLESTRVVLAKATSGFGQSPTITWDGNEYLLTWAGDMLIIDRQGQLKTKAAGSGHAAVASNGRGFLIAGTNGVWPINPNGSTFTPSQVAPLNTVQVALAAHQGVDYGLVWITADGSVGGATLRSPKEVEQRFTLGSARNSRQISITWAGDAYLATWESDGDLCSAKFGGSPSCEAVPNTQAEPALAFNGSTTVLAWIERASGVPDRVKVSMSTVASGRTISEAAQTQSNPVLLPGGVAWVEWVAARDRSQVFIDGRALLPIDLDQISLAAAGGETTLLVWNELDARKSYDGAIVGAVVDRNRQLVAGPIVIGSGAAPAVAYDGREWLVSWQSHAYPTTDILIAKVTASGVVVPAGGTAAALDGYDQFTPVLAWSGRSFILVWSELPRSTQRYRLERLILDANGIPLGPTDTLDEMLQYGIIAPSVAWNGKQFFVVWRHGDDLKAANVDPNGIRLDLDQLVLGHNAGRVKPGPRGSFVVLAPPLMITVSSEGDPGATFQIPFAPSAGFDFITTDTDVFVVYSRATKPEEMMGLSWRLFTQTLSFRRHAVR